MDPGSQPLRHRRTKIVATLGPASQDRATISELIGAGVNVFRLNLSHGTHEEHRVLYERVREAAAKSSTRVAVFADLCGPKIRVGKFPEGAVELRPGTRVTVTTREVAGRPDLIPSQYEALARDVRLGDRVLLDDGNLELRVVRVEGTEITCDVAVGGVLKDHKGMNLPGVAVSAPALTDKDVVDARFALALGVDFLALSFVRWPSDVQRLRDLIHVNGRDVPIISKIEKPEALENIEAIIDASDAIMVARGDLGVELPPEAVPNVQEELVDLARVRAKPVIVATQMLESMITNPRPTRAEVTDVANAVRSGADAVMLSGESAAGKHPLEAVRMMDLVVRQAESYLYFHGAFGTFDYYTPTIAKPEPPLTVREAVANATAQLSRELLVRAIVVVDGGRSLSFMSSARPAAPVVGASSDAAEHAMACLEWGVIPVDVGEDDPTLPNVAGRIVRDLDLAVPGDRILVVRGFSTEPGQNMPSVTVVSVE